MSRFSGLVAFFVIASPIWAQDLIKLSAPPRVDRYGDPLHASELRRLGTVRFRQEYVNDMAYMPDGKSLVVVSSDRVVQWDVATGKPLRVFSKSPLGNDRSLGLSPDGRLIAVRPEGKSVVVYNMSTGREQFRRVFDLSFPSSVISPDNSLLAISSDDRSALVDLKTGEERARMQSTQALKFSPDGKWLAGRVHKAHEDHIILFDAKTGREHSMVRPVKNKDVDDVSILGFGFTPDGQSLITSWWGSGTLIYDLKNQKVARHLPMDAYLVAISPDSKVLVATKERTVILASIETGAEIRRWQLNDTVLVGAYGAFSPDGKTLALGFECGIQLWDPATGKRVDQFRGAVHIPQHLAVSDDSKTFAVLFGRHAGQFLQVFDTETLEEKARLDAKPFTLSDLSFSPDGRRLAFKDWPIIDRGKHNCQVRVMDLATGKEVTQEKKILGFFSHWKGNDVIVVAGETLKGQGTWVSVDVASGKELNRTPIPKDSAMSTYVPSHSNTSRRMVVSNGPASVDRQVFLAEWPSGKRLRPLVFSDKNDSILTRSVFSLSPDERLILSDGIRPRQITVLETATGRERFQIESKKPDEFVHAYFSPDSRLIVVIHAGRRTILDALTFEPLMELIPRTGYGSSLAFSANGKAMVMGDTSAVAVWDLKTALHPRKTSSKQLSDARLGELWAELESTDARVGHVAMVALVRRPDEAVAFLKSKLPGPPPDVATFQRLIRDLDDPRFEKREAAHKAIAQMGASATARIRESLKDPPSLEVKRRLTSLAENLVISDGDRIRWLRCAELLERIGSPAARVALESLQNVPDPESADNAGRSLERLATLVR